MNQKEFLILGKIHRSNLPVSAEYLAEYFDMNVKTIRKYIESISTQYENIVEIVDGSYIVNRKKSSKALNEYIIHVPETEEGRLKYIIYTVCMQSHMKMNIYDLCEMMFVSRPFLMSLITKLKKKVSIYNVYINTKKDIISIEGNEFDIQKLLFDDIINNYAKVTPTPTLLNLIFEEVGSYTLFNMVKNTYYRVNGVRDDYRCFDLTVKICILITRIKKDFRLSVDIAVDLPFIEDICNLTSRIELDYALELNDNEKKLINIWMSPTNPYKKIEHSDAEIKRFVHEQIDLIANKYDLKLTEKTTCTDLEILVKNIIYRSRFHLNLVLQKNIEIRNSVFRNASSEFYEAIKLKFQIIHSNDEKLNLFIFMIEHFKIDVVNENLIKIGMVILNTPKNYAENFLDLEMSKYMDLMRVEAIWSCEDEINSELVDAIISFQDLIKFYSVPVLVLDSIYFNENISKLNKFIEYLREAENNYYY